MSVGPYARLRPGTVLKSGSRVEVSENKKNPEDFVLPPNLRGSPSGFAPAVVDSSNFQSKGKNTPLDGATLTGQVVATVYGGRVVHDSENRFAVERKGALDG